jgi:hypothetical protein
MKYPLFAFCLIALTGLTTLCSAQDSNKAQAFAEDVVKKLDLKSANIIDRKDFLLVSTLPEARAKIIADTLQTVSTMAKSSSSYCPTWIFTVPLFDAFKNVGPKRANRLPQ